MRKILTLSILTPNFKYFALSFSLHTRKNKNKRKYKKNKKKIETRLLRDYPIPPPNKKKCVSFETYLWEEV